MGRGFAAPSLRILPCPSGLEFLFSLYLSIRGLRKGPGKFLTAVLESPGFFCQYKSGNPGIMMGDIKTGHKICTETTANVAYSAYSCSCKSANMKPK